MAIYFLVWDFQNNTKCNYFKYSCSLTRVNSLFYFVVLTNVFAEVATFEILCIAFFAYEL